MVNNMTWQMMTIRLGLALVLGIIIGLERQLRQNSTDLRMNALVAVGAASFVLFGVGIGQDSLARVAGQIVTGIGFLGAGVIMREGASIKGIATAATLWCSAAVGMFAGAGFALPATICAAFIVAANLFLRPLAWIIKKRLDVPRILVSNHNHVYAICVTCRNDVQEHIRALILQETIEAGLHLHKLESKNAETIGNIEISIVATSVASRDSALEHIVGHLSMQPSVIAAKWGAQSEI